MAADVQVVVAFNKLPGLIDDLFPKAQRVLERHGRRVARDASNRTDRVRTGKMKAGYRSEMAGDEVLVFNIMPYHRWQELGTRHIRPGFWLTSAAKQGEPQLLADLAEAMVP